MAQAKKPAAKKPAPKKAVSSARSKVIASKKKGLSSLQKGFWAAIGVVILIVVGFSGLSLYQDLGASAADSAATRANTLVRLDKQVERTADTVAAKKALYDTAVKNQQNATTNHDATHQAYADTQAKLASAKSLKGSKSDAANSAYDAAVTANANAKKANALANATLTSANTRLKTATANYEAAKKVNQAAIDKLQDKRAQYALEDAADNVAVRNISVGHQPTGVTVTAKAKTSTKNPTITISFTKPDNISPEKYAVRVWGNGYEMTKYIKTTNTSITGSFQTGSTYNVTVTGINIYKKKEYTAATSTVQTVQIPLPVPVQKK